MLVGSNGHSSRKPIKTETKYVLDERQRQRQRERQRKRETERKML